MTRLLKLSRPIVGNNNSICLISQDKPLDHNTSYIHICHAGQLYRLRLPRRAANGAWPALGGRRLRPRLISAYYSFIDPERMKGWVDLVGWSAADGLPTWVVTRQLQVGAIRLSRSYGFNGLTRSTCR